MIAAMGFNKLAKLSSVSDEKLMYFMGNFHAGDLSEFSDLKISLLFGLRTGFIGVIALIDILWLPMEGNF